MGASASERFHSPDFLEGFWVKENYYISNGAMRFASSLDAAFNEPLVFPHETHWICEEVEQRGVCNVKSGEDGGDFVAQYAILRALIPGSCRTIRVGFWTGTINTRFSRVENGMLTLAIAATGLSL